jgi:hypothetical protein
MEAQAVAVKEGLAVALAAIPVARGVRVPKVMGGRRTNRIMRAVVVGRPTLVVLSVPRAGAADKADILLPTS